MPMRTIVAEDAAAAQAKATSVAGGAYTTLGAGWGGDHRTVLGRFANPPTGTVSKTTLVPAGGAQLYVMLISY